MQIRLTRSGDKVYICDCLDVFMFEESAKRCADSHTKDGFIRCARCNTLLTGTFQDGPLCSGCEKEIGNVRSECSVV